MKLEYLIYGVIFIVVVIFLVSFGLKDDSASRDNIKQTPFNIGSAIIKTIVAFIIMIGILVNVYLFVFK